MMTDFFYKEEENKLKRIQKEYRKIKIQDRLNAIKQVLRKSKIYAFLRGWWYTRTQRDPEVVAKALGRPDTLELTDEQANLINHIFVEAKAEIDWVAREFYAVHPRHEFRYFMVPSSDGQALEYSKVDYNIEGIELIYAAMRKVGAIVVKEDGEYFENAHPMVQRFAEIASKMQIPERKGRGILG